MSEIKSTDDYFWTIKEAARFLKISPFTLRQYINSHKKNMPPVYRPTNGHLRFIKEELIDWAKQQRK